MTIHTVKSWKILYQPAIGGVKTHDMRRADRNYKVGDFLILQEYEQNVYRYTGRQAMFEITYITSYYNPCALSENGLEKDYVILSIKLVGELKNKEPYQDYDKHTPSPLNTFEKTLTSLKLVDTTVKTFLINDVKFESLLKLISYESICSLIKYNPEENWSIVYDRGGIGGTLYKGKNTQLTDKMVFSVTPAKWYK